MRCSPKTGPCRSVGPWGRGTSRWRGARWTVDRYAGRGTADRGAVRRSRSFRSLHDAAFRGRCVRVRPAWTSASSWTASGRGGTRPGSTAIPTCSPSSASGCSPGPGSSSPTSPSCHGPATSSCAASSTTRSSSVRDDRGEVHVLAQHVPAPGHAGLPGRGRPRLAASAARTTPGRTATTAASSACRSTPRPTAATPVSTRPTHGLVTPPRVASYRGLVFANLDPAAPPLEDALGDFGFFLDFYVHQSAGGAELRGPQRWRVQCNWKIAAENFAGDSYHTPHTHATIVDIGLFREPTANKRKEGALYFAGGGGGTTYKLPTEDCRREPAPTSATRRRWSSGCARRGRPSTRRMVGPGRFMVSAATAFPNLSFVHNWPQVRRRGRRRAVRVGAAVAADQRHRDRVPVVVRRRHAARPTTSRRRPTAPTSCASGRPGCSSRTTSRTGRRSRTWPRAVSASQVELDSTMGMAPGGGTLGRAPERWYGPGSAVVGYGEYNQRALLAWWARHLADRGGDGQRSVTEAWRPHPVTAGLASAGGV